MAHIRKQIRDAVATACTGLPTTGANLFRGRTYAMSEEWMPALVVVSSGEQVSLLDPEQRQPAERMQQRSLSVQVVALVSESREEDVQDSLDQIALEVEQAVFADPSLGGIAANTEITSTRLAPFQEGDRGTLGQLELTFQIDAFATEGDPSDLLTQN